MQARQDDQLSARITEIRPLAGVRAGSALVRYGPWLYVVQDDALAVVRVDPATGATEAIALEGAGQAMPKAEKPDFESALVDPQGRLLVLGSGSAPRRRRWGWLDLETHRATLHEAEALYEAITAALGETPNIEGAVMAGARLRLFHRGAGATPSQVVEVPYDAAGPQPRVEAVERLEIGRVGQVPLHVTDAARRDDGAVMFLAAAEDTPNAYDDGPVVGAAVGVLGPAGGRWALLTEPDGTPSVRKAEGLAIGADGGESYLVTDPDDPDRPAELCRLALGGSWSA